MTFYVCIMYIYCMVKEIVLDPEEKSFFLILKETAFINPFSSRRQELNRKLAGIKNLSGEPLLRKMICSVATRMKQVESEERDNLKLYTGEDREMMRVALLFDIYHRFIDDFELLIKEQIKVGDTTCTVPFSTKVLTLLRRKGFKAGEALHYFAFFYQLRRAHYFIYSSLAGHSSSMEELRCHLWNNIFTYDTQWYEDFLWNRMEDFSTFILGETGTGKGTVAAAIGRSGYIPFDEKKSCFAESFTSNFIPINLSQFPETIIESELFGHKKGAFTGAVENHQGVFSHCKPHGTIFLDEIGEISIPVQIKLLKVIQERTFQAVGSHQSLRFHGRVIAATNKPLDELRREGSFRDDFFYRLCSDVISVPSLSQQIAEEPATLRKLLEHTISRITGSSSPSLLKTVLKVLEKELPRGYSWPGNVRELEQAVRRIILTNSFSGDACEAPTDLQSRLHQGIDDGALNAQEILAAYCTLLYQRCGTYEEVARKTKLDRRTVKKHVQITNKVKDHIS
ncbi:MAG: sigma-54-dependent Fis family transcriptional regulator [Candidatus Scalindua sp.]|nr:sigma-54-dependent Fis family transcriptional regulator [Candidatus Scalindua sp.]